MKIFNSIEKMIDWKAQKQHKSNLNNGGCYSEGIDVKLKCKGYEFKKIDNDTAFYRYSSLIKEKENIQVCKDLLSGCMVIYGDNGIVAKVEA